MRVEVGNMHIQYNKKPVSARIRVLPCVRRALLTNDLDLPAADERSVGLRLLHAHLCHASSVRSNDARVWIDAGGGNVVRVVPPSVCRERIDVRREAEGRIDLDLVRSANGRNGARLARVCCEPAEADKRNEDDYVQYFYAGHRDSPRRSTEMTSR